MALVSWAIGLSSPERKSKVKRPVMWSLRCSKPSVLDTKIPKAIFTIALPVEKIRAKTQVDEFVISGYDPIRK